MTGLNGAGNRALNVPGEVLAPYRLLAMRVIALAVRDLVTSGESAPECVSARAFLSGSRMLTHWCALAGLNPQSVRTQLGEMLEHGRPFALPEEK